MSRLELLSVCLLISGSAFAQDLKTDLIYDLDGIDLGVYEIDGDVATWDFDAGDFPATDFIISPESPSWASNRLPTNSYADGQRSDGNRLYFISACASDLTDCITFGSLLATSKGATHWRVQENLAQNEYLSTEHVLLFEHAGKSSYLTEPSQSTTYLTEPSQSTTYPMMRWSYLTEPSQTTTYPMMRKSYLTEPSQTTTYLTEPSQSTTYSYISEPSQNTDGAL